jgi:hypothetical protein
MKKERGGGTGLDISKLKARHIGIEHKVIQDPWQCSLAWSFMSKSDDSRQTELFYFLFSVCKHHKILLLWLIRSYKIWKSYLETSAEKKTLIILTN